MTEEAVQSIARLKDLGVSEVAFDSFGKIQAVKFFYPESPKINYTQTSPVYPIPSLDPEVSDMPPDDMLLFAATEDIDQAMKDRKKS